MLPGGESHFDGGESHFDGGTYQKSQENMMVFNGILWELAYGVIKHGVLENVHYLYLWVSYENLQS